MIPGARRNPPTFPLHRKHFDRQTTIARSFNHTLQLLIVFVKNERLAFYCGKLKLSVGIKLLC